MEAMRKTATRRILPPLDWYGAPIVMDLGVRPDGLPGRFAAHVGGEVIDDPPIPGQPQIGVCTALVWKGLVMGFFEPEVVHPFAWGLLHDLLDASPDLCCELTAQCAEWRAENGLPPCVQGQDGAKCEAPCASLNCSHREKE